MKIILTGCTGFCGAEALRHCLKSDKVDSVVVLSRRPLSESSISKDIDSSDPKLNVVIQKDMTNYTPEIMKALDGADACIWNLGTVPNKHSTAETTLTALEIPQAAVKAFSAIPRPSGAKPFNLVFTSGFLAERDQQKKGWFFGMEEFLKMRGQTESILAEHEEANKSTFRTYILRLAKPWGPNANFLASFPLTIKVNELAACMLHCALYGGEKQTLTNAEMKVLGRQAFKQGL